MCVEVPLSFIEMVTLFAKMPVENSRLFAMAHARIWLIGRSLTTKHMQCVVNGLHYENISM